jgi:hypothetical protein
VQQVTPAEPKPAAKPKRAVPKNLHFTGAKLKAAPKAKPKAKPKQKPRPQLKAHLAAQSRAAPSPPAPTRQTGPTPLRKPEATVARAVSAAGGGGGGSSLALLFLIGLGGLGGLLLAAATVPNGVLASTHLHRRLAQHRVDVAITGATMLGCLLVLLALGR